MAQLKSGSTIGGTAISNKNLDGVSRSNFNASQLAQIKGNTGSNGSSGSSADSNTWSVAGTALTISGSGYTLSGTTLSINTY